MNACNNTRTVSEQISTSHDEYLNLSWISKDKILFKLEFEGIYLLDLESQQDSVSPMQIISTSLVYQIEVSPDLKYYAFVSSPSGFHYGAIGNWSPNLLTQSLPNDIDWSPTNDGIVCSMNDGVHWITLDGRDYPIIRYQYYMSSGWVSAAPK